MRDYLVLYLLSSSFLVAVTLVSMHPLFPYPRIKEFILQHIYRALDTLIIAMGITILYRTIRFLMVE